MSAIIWFRIFILHIDKYCNVVRVRYALHECVCVWCVPVCDVCVCMLCVCVCSGVHIWCEGCFHKEYTFSLSTPSSTRPFCRLRGERTQSWPRLVLLRLSLMRSFSGPTHNDPDQNSPLPHSVLQQKSCIHSQNISPFHREKTLRLFCMETWGRNHS